MQKIELSKVLIFYEWHLFAARAIAKGEGCVILVSGIQAGGNYYLESNYKEPSTIYF
jgi:hypothetical protein